MKLKKVYLELTNKCNLDCSICYRKSWNEKLCDMDRELFDGICEQISSEDEVESIVLGGIGEPTFSPLIYDAIERFKDYYLTITTNGTIMKDELLELMVNNVDEIIVSIDGLDDELQRIRGIELNIITENLKRLITLKKIKDSRIPSINIQFVATKDNIDDIFPIIDLADSLKADSIIVSNLLPQSDENKEKILYTRYENKSIKELFHKINNYSFRRGMKIYLPNCELKTERRCNFVDDDTTYISSCGDVVPCYRFSHAYKEYVFGRVKLVDKYTFGNLNDNSLASIWNSEEYVKFRNAVHNNLYPSCIDCDLVEGCDMVNDSAMDCYGYSPSCGDCLWSRKFVICT
ncbi:tungsten cofactor oxidoreductase radical SAM maturase [Wukongibacter baidiensis]|uniref:tungsten cofactor oxidoreductase radical SAM maturase n=1 Tax=Wukongibacter baidiensis TaxID=1723361 RepID=UPI003D7FE999